MGAPGYFLSTPTVTVICEILLGLSIPYIEAQSGAQELIDGCAFHPLSHYHTLEGSEWVGLGPGPSPVDGALPGT